MLSFGVGDVAGLVLLLMAAATVSHSQSIYVCPKKFVAIGKKCYYFSKDEAVWHDAHFRCGNFNSSLAIIANAKQELGLRRYLNKRNDGKYERWLGGRYNEKQSKWVWGENGKPLVFHGFSRMNANDRRWAWHCIIVDPARQNKWGAKSCIEATRYICQRPVLGKKKFNKSRCLRLAKSDDSRELCLKQNTLNAEPAYLVKRLKKEKNPYHIATFVCPSHMILVGRKCYFFSTDKASWSDAYWACRDNRTKMAVITTRMQDNILRGFLRGTFTAEKHERWIGGIYDWKQDTWKWAMSGKAVKYKNFAKETLVESKNNTHHCITLDPQFDNLWNSKNRLEEKHYICQGKIGKVVKYDRPLKKPDATVFIKLTEENKLNIQKNLTFTTPSSSYYNNEVTEKYIYN